MEKNAGCNWPKCNCLPGDQCSESDMSEVGVSCPGCEKGLPVTDGVHHNYEQQLMPCVKAI